jgi:uncharacterized protein YqeY
MNLEDLRKKLIESQKSQDQVALSTVRLLMSEAKNREISLRGESKEVASEDYLKMVKKQIKNRNESIPMYEKAGRTETAEKEKKEVVFLKSLLTEFFPDEPISQ